MNKILTDALSPNIYGDGGHKSDYMVSSILADFNIESLPLVAERVIMRSNYVKCLSSFKHLPSIMPYAKWFSQKELIHQLLRWHIQLIEIDKRKSLQSSNIFLWRKSLASNWYLVPMLKPILNGKIIAYPHNLESLVPRSKNIFNEKKWLDIEIELFSQCDEVFVVSREEQWVLNTYGIKAEYLPYFPPDPLYSELINIRDFRKSSTLNNNFLILGTVHNTPTYLGMEKLLTYLSQHFNNINSQIFVAGFGTEVFRTKFHSKNINIIGTISKGELNNTLKKISGIILSNEFSSGALTRIIEMLIAGIPIFANIASKRSYWEYDDVHVYNTFEELSEMLHSNFPMPFLPVKDEYSSQLFRNAFL